MACHLTPIIFACSFSFLASLAGCATSPDRPARGTGDALEAVDPARRHAELMGREAGPFERHRVELFDGSMVGQIESQTAPKTECADEDGERTCTFEALLGADLDGDQVKLTCIASATLVPFGMLVKLSQGEFVLTEVPDFTTAAVDDGIAASLQANVEFESETDYLVGTLKIATLYSHGRMITCLEPTPGRRETFERVTADYFASVQFEGTTDSAPLFSLGYRSRRGEQDVGLRYGQVTRRTGEAAGYLETSISFGMEVKESSWKVWDHIHRVKRDETGAIESYETVTAFNGSKGFSLTAKPSEEGRFRIKAEMGGNSDSLELTPKAVLSTELWSAGELRKLAKGRGQVLYAAPTLGADGDPTLQYIELRAEGAGTVSERVIQHLDLGKQGTDAADQAVPDTLHLDDRGLVVKEIAVDKVHELAFTRGQLPDATYEHKGRRRRR